jgi:hypothetical protein
MRLKTYGEGPGIEENLGTEVGAPYATRRRREARRGSKTTTGFALTTHAWRRRSFNLCGT